MTGVFYDFGGEIREMTEDHLAAHQAEIVALFAPKIDDYKRAFDDHMDAIAQSKLYDNRVTIATYSGSSYPQWAAEASAFIAWRDVAMLSMFAQLEAVQAGASAPTVSEFIAALPAIEWPAL